MAMYMLAHGHRRLPIDGIRVTPREGLPPLRKAETILFEENRPVESDLDFEPWVRDGILIRLPEPGQRPMPGPAPVVKDPSAPLTPMPAGVRATVQHEVPRPAPVVPVAESHLTTAPKPMPAEAMPPANAPAASDLADAGVPASPRPDPTPEPTVIVEVPEPEAPVLAEEESEESEEEPEAPLPKAKAEATAKGRPQPKGRHRKGR